jgi:hypothetical protein
MEPYKINRLAETLTLYFPNDGEYEGRVPQYLDASRNIYASHGVLFDEALERSKGVIVCMDRDIAPGESARTAAALIDAWKRIDDRAERWYDELEQALAAAFQQHGIDSKE